MKFSLRPTTIGDLGTLRQFLQRAFHSRSDAPFVDPFLMAWKYWDQRGDWEGPRSYVLERDGVMVAHAGIYPLTFGAGEVRGVQLIDWASAKEAPGAGVALLRKLTSMFDFMYGIGGSEITRKILPACGFVEYVKQWRGARPLRPFQQILKHQHRNWRLAPRLVRNFLWTVQTTPDGFSHEGWKSGEIGPEEISKHYYSQGMADACFSPRPPAFFEYLLRCPAMKIRLYGIQDQSGPKGHFAIGVLRGQARVAGVWLRDPGSKAWQAAFSLARQVSARLEGACEIAVAGTAGPSEQAAIQSGLRIMGHTPVYIPKKGGKLALPPDFQFQLSDDDSLFLDSGNSSFWT